MARKRRDQEQEENRIKLEKAYIAEKEKKRLEFEKKKSVEGD
jgi:hypothetical protein